MTETFFTRRNLLKAGLGMAALTALPALPGCSAGGDAGTGRPATDSPTSSVFPQPQVRSSQFGLLDTGLEVRTGVTDLGSRSVTTQTFEGTFPAPTLRIKAGDTLRIKLTNNLPADTDPVPADRNTPHHFNTTNLHTHGLHVSPQEPSDNVFVLVEPEGGTYQYEYHIPADHPPGTYWYHPHNHGATSVQLFGGMAGALIIEGGVDEVPEVKAAADVVMVINELNIDGQGTVPLYTKTGVFPLNQRLLTINGRLLPTITMRPGEVQRWRVINATVRTLVEMQLQGHTLNVIARDAITVPNMIPVASEVMGAGNRSDVLVQASTQAGLYTLVRKAVGNVPSGGEPEQVLAYVQVVGELAQMSLPTGPLPTPEALPDIDPGEVTNFRTLTFAVAPGGPAFVAPNVGNFPNFTIDGQRFDPTRVDHPVPLGAVEEWTLINTSNVEHPFHIHVNDFQVFEVNGVAQPLEWRDTITIPAKVGNVNGSVRFRTRFEDFTGKFVLHCHILQHEDIGMMQVVEVQ